MFCIALAVQAAQTPAALVDPFVGTLGDYGQLSPAAVAPYGMVQLGPDTDLFNHAGYDYAATKLLGLSHTRAVGVGCSGAGGDLRVSATFEDAPDNVVIDKSGEMARAGYYRVPYGDGIIAEATATRGVGILRFTVPRAGKVKLALDPRPAYSSRLSAQWHSGEANDLRATLKAGTVCDAGAYTVHTASEILHQGVPVLTSVVVEESGLAVLNLDVDAGDAIEVRTGLSSVDSEAAAAVLGAEVGERSFEEVASATFADWEHELGRITVNAPSDQRALFYTSLFRVMQTPVAIADPDGRYRGSDGQLQHIQQGKQRYTSWALWDNYRTQLPLIALVDPDRAADIARSLTALYGEGKRRWATQSEPFLTVRTEHAGVALLDFYRKGITDFDAGSALAGMAKESPLLVRGAPDERIEAAYDDWAIAELADELGDKEIAAKFRAKSESYRDIWLSVFDRLEDDADVVGARGLYQGTIWQYRWAPVFDLPWLADTLGDRLLLELGQFFAENLYNMTNQPSIHVPWLLAWSGDRLATAEIIRRYLGGPTEHGYTNAGKRPKPWRGHSFALSPQGFADGMDDDAGTMSAWYVWGTLGMYPLVPGEPYYVLGTPAVCGATIHQADGRDLKIAVAQGADINAPLLNEQALGSNQLKHTSIAAGGVLTFPASGEACVQGMFAED